jgi:hypothetical protein
MHRCPRHFSRAACDLVNAGGCGGRRKSRITNFKKGSIMNVKTNVKVGWSINPRPEPLH